MIGHVVACYGAADRYLGMLAAALGEVGARARRTSKRAMELNRRMGAATWLAHTAYEYGRLLLLARSADRERADALLAEAAALGRADRHAGAARPDRRARRDRRRRHAARTGSPPARRRSSASSRAGSATARSAAALVISEHTAANHIRSILRKTGCANRTEAASYAHRRGLVVGVTRRLRSGRCRST